MMVRTHVSRWTIRACRPSDYPLTGATIVREERVYSGRNRGQDRYLAGAFERMTDGGVHVEIDESTAGRPVDPWGRYRFCAPTPAGGLRFAGINVATR